jgi:hypothetical protein
MYLKWKKFAKLKIITTEAMLRVNCASLVAESVMK